MTYIYAFANQKGGVGKTTSAVNLTAYLAALGRRVLLVDMDAQANASSSMGIDKNKLAASSYDVLLGNVTAAKATLKNEKYNLHIIPSSPALAAAEIELVGELAREYRLRQALATEVEKYDYILIDCPPSLGLLTVNALTAELIDELSDALNANQPPAVRVVVLRAPAGSHVFSAGHDVSELPRNGRDPLTYNDPLRKIVRQIEAHPTPALCLFARAGCGAAASAGPILGMSTCGRFSARACSRCWPPGRS